MGKEYRIFREDGRDMQFNSDAFGGFFMDLVRRRGVRRQELEAEIGEAVGVSRDAVHNWRFGQNGPSDINIIIELARFMGIGDYRNLLRERREGVEMQVTERQKDSLKKIYDAVIDYLDEFERTDGFNDHWFELSDKADSGKTIEMGLYEIAEREQDKVRAVLRKEYIIIHKLEVYPKLEEYVNDRLTDIYADKLSYGYRFEAGVENMDGTRDAVMTYEDYSAALEGINALMDPYLS